MGYVLRKRRLVRREFLNGLMVFNIVGPVTILTLLSFWAIQLRTSLVWLPILGVVMQLIPGLCAFALVRRRYTDPHDQGSFVLALMLANRGTVGILPVYMFFGEAGYTFARLVMLLAPFVVFLGCYPMARHYYERGVDSDGDRRPRLLSILVNRNQLPVLGIGVGLAPQYSGVPRPAVCGAIFPWLMHTTLILLVIPVGFAIEFRKMRQYVRDLPLMFLLKFLVTPALIYLLALAVGLSGAPLYTAVILAASPTAINAVVAVQIHKLNADLVMASFVLTTACYLALVVPLMILLRALFG